VTPAEGGGVLDLPGLDLRVDLAALYDGLG
jgi:hypothetical protein